MQGSIIGLRRREGSMAGQRDREQETATPEVPPVQLIAPVEVHEALASRGCSVCTKKGNKSSAPNQDRAACLVIDGGQVELLTVMDGHGEQGHTVAQLACEVLPPLLLRELPNLFLDPLNALTDGPTVTVGPQNPQEDTDWAAALHEAAVGSFAETHRLIELITTLSIDTGKGPPEGWPQIDARASGTTATVVVLLPGSRALIAHVGDSRAVLGCRRRDSPTDAWDVRDLTRDHKPDLPEERARVEAAGAKVHEIPCKPTPVHRVYTLGQTWPLINMSRSLGDLHAHTQGLSCVAEVSVVEQLWDAVTEDAVLIVASDGIWDVLSPSDAIQLVTAAKAGPEDPARVLANEAYSRWTARHLPDGYTDDITAVVKFL